jgi:hypothetical protein
MPAGVIDEAECSFDRQPRMLEQVEALYSI